MPLPEKCLVPLGIQLLGGVCGIMELDDVSSELVVVSLGEVALGKDRAPAKQLLQVLPRIILGYPGLLCDLGNATWQGLGQPKVS